MIKHGRTGRGFLIITSILYVLVFLFYYNSYDLDMHHVPARIERPLSTITGNVMSDGSTVERRFSSATVNPGDTVTVYLDVTISQGPQSHTYYAIEEYVPSSLTIVSSGTGSKNGHTIRWIYINDTEQAPSVTYSYTVNVPSAGNHDFDGIFWIEGMSSDATTEGDTRITASSCTPTGPEYCDGQDNDCDPGTPDGSDESWYSQPCDGPDSDLCKEGVFQCVSGNKVCSDNTPNTAEICNDNKDNDCDGNTDMQDTDCWECTDNGDCDDGLFCNGDEYCSGHKCYTTPRVIDDNVDCTVDSCDDGSDTVIHTPDNSYCSNGLWCDGQETCDAVNGCTAGTAPDCSDQYSCTDDYCNESGDKCQHSKNDNNCAAGESCEPVYFGAPDGCGIISGCTGAQDGTLCDDGIYCNGVDECQSQACVNVGPAVDCDDNVPCTDDVCSESAKDCVHAANNALCDDGKWCDGNEYCDASAGCLNGTAPSIDDNVDCTVDSCDESNDVVVHTPTDSLCDNSLWCDGQETCDAADGCQQGTAPDCSDQYSCTDDSCNENANRCDNIANDASCPSGESCAPLYFPDNTGCGAIVDCTGQPDGTLCDDGVYCNGVDECQSQACVNIGPVVDCDDGESCTDDMCNESAERCDSIPIDDDGDSYDICSGSNQDCDDSRASVNPGESENCNNGRDDDCDGQTDINDSSCSFCTSGDKQLCPKQQGVCSGSKETCTEDGEWPGCGTSVYSSWNSKYQPQETSCDGKDNDCDGKVDEGCSSSTSTRSSSSTSSSTSTGTTTTRTRTTTEDTSSQTGSTARTRTTPESENQSQSVRAGSSRSSEEGEKAISDEQPKTIDEVLDENSKSNNTMFYILFAVLIFIGIGLLFYFKKRKINFNPPPGPPQYRMLGQGQPPPPQSLDSDQQKIMEMQQQLRGFR